MTSNHANPQRKAQSFADVLKVNSSDGPLSSHPWQPDRIVGNPWTWPPRKYIAGEPILAAPLVLDRSTSPPLSEYSISTGSPPTPSLRSCVSTPESHSDSPEPQQVCGNPPPDVEIIPSTQIEEDDTSYDFVLTQKQMERLKGKEGRRLLSLLAEASSTVVSLMLKVKHVRFVGLKTNTERGCKYLQLFLAETKSAQLPFLPKRGLRQRRDMLLLYVPTDCVGYCVGKGGQTVQKMEADFKVWIFTLSKSAKVEEMVVCGESSGRRQVYQEFRKLLSRKNPKWIASESLFRPVEADQGEKLPLRPRSAAVSQKKVEASIPTSRPNRRYRHFKIDVSEGGRPHGSKCEESTNWRADIAAVAAGAGGRAEASSKTEEKGYSSSSDDGFNAAFSMDDSTDSMQSCWEEQSIILNEDLWDMSIPTEAEAHLLGNSFFPVPGSAEPSSSASSSTSVEEMCQRLQVLEAEREKLLHQLKQSVGVGRS